VAHKYSVLECCLVTRSTWQAAFKGAPFFSGRKWGSLCWYTKHPGAVPPAGTKCRPRPNHWSGVQDANHRALNGNDAQPQPPYLQLEQVLLKQCTLMQAHSAPPSLASSGTKNAP